MRKCRAHAETGRAGGFDPTLAPETVRKYQNLLERRFVTWCETQKTGTPVYVPLPPAAVKALAQLDGDGERFFTSGNAKPQTARASREPVRAPGHSSVRITERHYKPWVKTLQKKLEEEARKAWAK